MNLQQQKLFRSYRRTFPLVIIPISTTVEIIQVLQTSTPLHRFGIIYNSRNYLGLIDGKVISVSPHLQQQKLFRSYRLSLLVMRTTHLQQQKLFRSYRQSSVSLAKLYLQQQKLFRSYRRNRASRNDKNLQQQKLFRSYRRICWL